MDDIIAKNSGWKAELLTRLRKVIKQADPDVVEEVKWRMKTRPEGLAVWVHSGNLCLLEIFNTDAKLVFVKGALMKDLQAHFNARLMSKTDRAIEFHEGDEVDDGVISKLVKEAVRLNELKA